MFPTQPLDPLNIISRDLLFFYKISHIITYMLLRPYSPLPPMVPSPTSQTPFSMRNVFRFIPQVLHAEPATVR